MAKNGAQGWDGCCVHVRIVDKLLSGISASARSGKGKYEKWQRFASVIVVSYGNVQLRANKRPTG